MTEKKRTNFAPQTFSKVLSLLDCFTMQNKELSAKELGYLNKVSTSSLYRYLSIMEEHGYLVKNTETGKYSVGLRLIELGGIAMSQMEFRRHGQPALDRISSELRLNTNMGVLCEGDLLHIAFSIWVSGEPNYSIIGRRSAAHCTAMGKLLYSGMELSEVHGRISRYGWRPRTGKSIDTFQELDRELLAIREQGYAIDREEAAEGTCCIAFPIPDKNGHAVSAISATTDCDRFAREYGEIFACVKKNAEIIAYHMGYNGPYPKVIIHSSL